MIEYKKIDLQSLRLACYLYEKATKYDKGYTRIMSASLDITKDKDAQELMIFLQAWGCRHLFKIYWPSIINGIVNWYDFNKSKLSSFPSLANLNEADFKEVQEIFRSLSDTLAYKSKKGSVKIQTVAASKILLVLKGEIFAPLDTPMVKSLNLTKSSADYIEYLKRIRDHLMELSEEATSNHTSIAQYVFSPEFGIREKPLPKLIDQYYFVQITKGWDLELVKQLCIAG